MTSKFEQGADRTGPTLRVVTADRVLAIIEGYLESAETIPPELVPFNIDLMNLAGEHQDQPAIRALGEPGIFNGNIDRTFTTLVSLNILYYRSGEGFRIEDERMFQILRDKAANALGREDYEVLQGLGKRLGEIAVSDAVVPPQ